MDNTLLLQILSEVRTISERLKVIEESIKKEVPGEPIQPSANKASGALAHLSSLGINW
jgi:hypothetical protein